MKAAPEIIPEIIPRCYASFETNAFLHPRHLFIIITPGALQFRCSLSHARLRMFLAMKPLYICCSGVAVCVDNSFFVAFAG